MKWRKLYSRGEYRYHVGRKNVVIQRVQPWSDKKVVVPFTTLLNLPEEKIWYDDRIEGRVMFVGIEPSDIQKFVDASPVKAFDQPKQKRRK